MKYVLHIKKHKNYYSWKYLEKDNNFTDFITLQEFKRTFFDPEDSPEILNEVAKVIVVFKALNKKKKF